MQRLMNLLILIIVMMGSPVHALFKIAFVDIFPTMRLTTRSFNDEYIDRLFYTQYHLSPKAVVVGIDYEIYGIHFFIGLDFMKNLEAEFGEMAWTNLPVGKNIAGSASSNFPSEAFVGYKNDIVTASVGRRRVHLGPGNYSLLVSGDTPWLDGIFLSLHPKTVKEQRFIYSFFFAADDTAALKRLWRGFDPAFGDPTQNNRYEQRTKYFTLHRVGYQFDRVRFNISESSVIYGIPATFFNMNPFNFWHNTYEVGLNVTLGFDVEGVIGKKRNVRVYGEFLLDDVKTSVEKGGNPLAFGLTAGVQWQVFKSEDPEVDRHLGPNFNNDRNTLKEPGFRLEERGLTLGLQAVWATTYLYGRSIDDPLGKLTFHNQLQLGVGHWSVLENYLGFSYGPDNILLELQADYVDRHWRVRSTLGMLFWGKHGSADRGFLAAYRDEVQVGGLFDPDNLENVFFSGLDRLILIPNIKVYYAFYSWLSVYGGFSAEVDFLNFHRSRATLEMGVGMRF